MTTPSEPTTPTPEQRAATINDMCPEGWSVRPSGSSLAIVNPGAPDAPPAVIHADDASIVATIWTWHARALETSRTEALNTRREAVRCGEEVVAARLKLAEIVAEFSAGMFTPADFIKRAVDVDEALREIRERRRLDREERDAREAALVKAAKREDVPAELAPFAALSLADIGHAAWLCGYHPGDDPRKVFERAARRASEWQAIEALLADDLKNGRTVDPAMFPLARRLLIIDQHAVVDGNDPRAHIVKADVQSSQEQEQAAVVCSVMPTGEINVLKNRQDGKVGLITPVQGVTFAEMVWTGSAWVPTKPPVLVAVGETEAGPYSKQETLGTAEYGARFAEPLKLDIEGSVQVRDGLVVTGVDGPVPIHLRTPGWTGITWMSGRGRAKSLTVPGLQTRGDLGPNALRSAEMERLSRKTVKVLQRRDRLYAFHLPGGVKRYGHIDTWSHLRAGEPLAISIRPTPRT